MREVWAVLIVVLLLWFIWQRARAGKVYYIKLPTNYNAHTLPPFGIFLDKTQRGNANLLAHEQKHWAQYQKLGLLSYYGLYAYQYVKFGYDKHPMEIEARQNEDLYCQENYTQCVRDGKSNTVKNKKFRYD